MKKIAYLICDNGVDGRESTTQVFATWNEVERDIIFGSAVCKNWFHKSEVIVDLEKTQREAQAKLTAVEKMALGLPVNEPKQHGKGTKS